MLAAVYFSAVWLGESVRLSILTANITSAAKRLFGVPDFHYYAVADGISVLLTHLSRWRPSPLAHSPPPLDPQLSLAFPD